MLGLGVDSIESIHWSHIKLKLVCICLAEEEKKTNEKQNIQQQPAQPTISFRNVWILSYRSFHPIITVDMNQRSVAEKKNIHMNILTMANLFDMNLALFLFSFCFHHLIVSKSQNKWIERRITWVNNATWRMKNAVEPF